jgi:N4-gp56 family major capsid protein
MSKLNIATGATLAKKLYVEKLYRDVRKELYFDKFMSEKGDSAVYVKSDLSKEKGETMVFGLRMRLAQDGVTDNQKLEDNEEALTLHSHTVTLKQYRHAVRDDGALTRQRPAFDTEDEMSMAIKDWGAEKIDQLNFDALTSSPSKVFYRDGTTGAISASSAATAIAAITSAANSRISLNMISAIKSWAKSGGERQYIPIEPIKVGGEEVYVLLVHDDVLYDLETDSSFQQAQREALARSNDHPLFKGATAYWRGVVIHSHENIPIATNGSSIPYAKNAFFGRQALCWAWGRKPKVIDNDFDYTNEKAKAFDFIARASKPVFNSLDFGSLGFYTSRTAISAL